MPQPQLKILDNNFIPSQQQPSSPPYLEAAEQLLKEWQDAIGFYHPFMKRELIGWLSIGFEREVVSEAIYATTLAPRPSWVYLRAIMRRLQDDHCYTWDKWADRQLAFKTKGAISPTPDIF